MFDSFKHIMTEIKELHEAKAGYLTRIDASKQDWLAKIVQLSEVEGAQVQVE